jgi:hypothetical protein
MKSNLLFLKCSVKTETLSLNQINSTIAKFETTYKTSLTDRHRLRFLNGNFRSLKELETKLAAYRVFGDAGYGESCFKSF